MTIVIRTTETGSGRTTAIELPQEATDLLRLLMRVLRRVVDPPLETR